MPTLLAHCSREHAFDFQRNVVDWSTRSHAHSLLRLSCSHMFVAELDFYGCVRMINYIRKQVRILCCSFISSHYLSLTTSLHHLSLSHHLLFTTFLSTRFSHFGAPAVIAYTTLPSYYRHICVRMHTAPCRGKHLSGLINSACRLLLCVARLICLCRFLSPTLPEDAFLCEFEQDGDWDKESTVPPTTTTNDTT